jgi:U4/U6 small nuclear ribonucleoprotein PRP4
MTPEHTRVLEQLADGPTGRMRRALTLTTFVSNQANSPILFSTRANTRPAIDSNYSLPSGTAGGASHQTSSLLDEFARKRKAAAIAVPTDDKRVRTQLRSRGEPITLFGERPEDRRDRLRALLYSEQEGGGEDEDMRDVGDSSSDDGDEAEEEFYTEGSKELLEARRDIARYSLPRTAQRIAYQKEESTIPVETHVKHRKGIKERLSGFELFGSQIAGERPVSMVRFSPNGELIASGDWGGSIKLLDVPNLETKMTLRGHKSMIGGIAWYPGATMPSSTVTPDNLNLASAGGDGDIHLWSLTQDTPISTLSGHTARAVRTAFHPSGRYLASASYDTTWRLWDVNTTQELLLQEGHSKEVFTVAFNGDGSLAASAGLDSIGRIWDLRSGRTIMFLDAHVAPIHALDWGSDGYRVLTGSADGFAKCWDLRAVRETATIGAHRGGVTDLKWFTGSDGPCSGNPINRDDQGAMQPKKSGTFMVSAGFDKAVNIFSADDWAMCKSLTGHDGTVLAADVTDDARYIASCGRDRTVKLWARDDMEGI